MHSRGQIIPFGLLRSAFSKSLLRAIPTLLPNLARVSLWKSIYIEGQFQKWCNNYGFISAESQSLPAFMHWSWVHTKGELMVADLQGVWKEDGFVLTDPVIMSLNNSYGSTDTGTEGMVMFFYKHQCNSFCQYLPKPATRDFVSHVPRYQLATCLSKLEQLQGATTYRVDLNFGSETRQIVASVLRGVAARYQQF